MAVRRKALCKYSSSTGLGGVQAIEIKGENWHNRAETLDRADMYARSFAERPQSVHQ